MTIRDPGRHRSAAQEVTAGRKGSRNSYAKAEQKGWRTEIDENIAAFIGANQHRLATSRCERRQLHGQRKRNQQQPRVCDRTRARECGRRLDQWRGLSADLDILD